ncbi:hypothetical protein Taro_015086 [Colocasia esculenta]|uniref:Uncharacterized protein n=1 Tax=Colocasia esculenta TaxID=4460 RepID=A0A843UGX2_COLES|nr:hypothetical protein [Colocasia esculenta]
MPHPYPTQPRSSALFCGFFCCVRDHRRVRTTPATLSTAAVNTSGRGDIVRPGSLSLSQGNLLLHPVPLSLPDGLPAVKVFPPPTPQTPKPGRRRRLRKHHTPFQGWNLLSRGERMEEQFILRVPPSVAERIERLLNEGASSSLSEDPSLDLSFSGRSCERAAAAAAWGVFHCAFFFRCGQFMEIVGATVRGSTELFKEHRFRGRLSCTRPKTSPPDKLSTTAMVASSHQKLLAGKEVLK